MPWPSRLKLDRGPVAVVVKRSVSGEMRSCEKYFNQGNKRQEVASGRGALALLFS